MIESKITDYIKIYSNRLPNDFCDLIVDEYKNSDEWSLPYIGDGTETIDYTRRNCEVIATSQKDIIDKNPKVRQKIDETLFKTINDCLREYNNNVISGALNIVSDTGYTLLRYKKDQYITQHVDASSDIGRTLSCSIGLNSEYTGGEFAFFDKQIKFTLNKGDVLMFPSNFMYPHEILPVISGVRYSVLSWLF